MDADLKQYLDVKFTEVEVRFQSMDARMEAMEARLRQQVGIECEKVETKLLTEFHKWGRTSDMRTRGRPSPTRGCSARGCSRPRIAFPLWSANGGCDDESTAVSGRWLPTFAIVVSLIVSLVQVSGIRGELTGNVYELMAQKG